MAKITSAGLNGLIDKAKWPEYKKGKMFLPENKYSQSEKTQIKNLIKPILSLGKEWMAFDKDGKALSLKNWPNMIVKGDDRDIEKFILRAPYEVVEDILFQYGSDNTYSPIKDTIKADKNSPGQKPAGHHPDTIENGDKWDIVTLKFRDQPITFIPSTDKITIPGPAIDATTMTAIQEMASAYIFKRAIKDNQDLTTSQKIRTNDKGKDFKELVVIRLKLMRMQKHL